MSDFSDTRFGINILEHMFRYFYGGKKNEKRRTCKDFVYDETGNAEKI